MLKRVKSLFGSNEHVKETLKGGSIAMIYRVLAMGTNYVLLFYIPRLFGAHGMGVYNLCLAIVTILALVCSLGFNTAIVRFVAQYVATDKTHRVPKLYTSIVRLIVPLSILISAGLYFSSHYMAVKWYEDPELEYPFKILAFVLPLVVVLNLHVELMRSIKRIVVSELFRNLSIAVFTLIGLIVLSYTNHKEAYWSVAMYGIGVLLSFILIAPFVIKYLHQTKETLAQEGFGFRPYLTSSVTMMASALVQVLNGRIAIIILGWYYSTETMGVFGVAFKIAVVTEIIIYSLKAIMMPKISELFWSKRRDELNKLIQLSTRLTFFLSVPITIILLLFPEELLGIIGPEFVSGANTLRIFALAQFVNAASGLVGAFLNMTGNQKQFTIIISVALTVNVLLALFLIPSLGMEGGAIAALASTVVWNIWGAWYIYRKYQTVTFYLPLFRKR